MSVAVTAAGRVFFIVDEAPFASIRLRRQRRRNGDAPVESEDQASIKDHLFSRSGFLGDSWFFRPYWICPGGEGTPLPAATDVELETLDASVNLVCPEPTPEPGPSLAGDFTKVSSR